MRFGKHGLDTGNMLCIPLSYFLFVLLQPILFRNSFDNIFNNEKVLDTMGGIISS